MEKKKIYIGTLILLRTIFFSCCQYFALFRHESRDIVRNAVHASEDDAVIFVGSGCTGAVHKLIHAMDFASEEIKPIVLVGPYEHHSNLLPWREIGATVNIYKIRISKTYAFARTGCKIRRVVYVTQSLNNNSRKWQCFFSPLSRKKKKPSYPEMAVGI